MKNQRVLAITLIVFLVGCSQEDSGSHKLAGGNDSLRVADSIAGAVPRQENDLSYEERQGKVLYEQYCLVCHGQDGKGDGFNAFNLNPRPKDFSDSVYMNALGDKLMIQTISGGGRSVNKSPLMPSYGWTLKKEQIQYIVLYLRTFYSHK